MTSSRCGLLLICCVGLGCSFAPPKEPLMPQPLPATWSDQGAMTEDQKAYVSWWSTFKNDRLTALVTEALSQNRDIRAGISRVDQARAQAVIAGAPLFPRIDLSGSVGRNSFNTPNNSNQFSSPSLSTTSNSSTTTYRAGAAVSYEVDLWGKNRGLRNSAGERLLASEEDLNSLALVTSSDVADTFVSLLALQDRISIAEKNYNLAREVLAIIEARFLNGAVGALEPAQQKTALASVEASLVLLAREKQIAHNQLSILIGRFPQELGGDAGGLSTLALPVVTPFKPADILIRRPDIRSNEHQLEAARIDVGIARAAFFPSLQLTLGSTLSSTAWNGATSTLTSLASSLAQPVFRGGALIGEVDRTQARQKELLEIYGQSVRVAVREVEDALVSVKRNSERVEVFKKGVKSAETAYAVSRDRFQAGGTDYLPLLTTQSTLLQFQDNFIQARQDLFSSTIALYRALGGGW